MVQANSVWAKPSVSMGKMQVSMCDLWLRSSAFFWISMRQGGAKKGRSLADASMPSILCKLLRRSMPALVGQWGQLNEYLAQCPADNRNSMLLC